MWWPIYNQRNIGPGHAANVVDETIKTALSRRTVAHITIPKDIQDWTQDEARRSDQNIPQHSGNVYMPSWPLPPQPLLEVAVEMINAGTRVAILVGQGCLNAHDEVLTLAEKVGDRSLRPCAGEGCGTRLQFLVRSSDGLGPRPGRPARQDSE
jgi:pyruvate dehydrogenase (quinone)